MAQNRSLWKLFDDGDGDGDGESNDECWCLGMVNLKNSYFTHTELKQALKDFKAQRDDVQHPVVLYGFDLLFTYYFCALIACFFILQYLIERILFISLLSAFLKNYMLQSSK